MNALECIESRRSCRAFLPKPVEKKAIAKALNAAKKSPSYMNTQPWDIYVVMGAEKEALAKRLHDKAASDTPRMPYLALPQDWPEELKKRAEENRNKRFELLGLNPATDSEKIREGMLQNFRFFGAPCVVFAAMEKSLTSWSVFDMGSFIHAFLLGLHEEGLGGVPQAQPVSYPDVISNELGIPDSKAIIIAVSVGYPDKDALINRHESSRKEMNDFVYWYD